MPRSNNAQKQQRPDNDGIKGLVFGLPIVATDPTALLCRRLSRWLLFGVQLPLYAVELLFSWGLIQSSIMATGG